VFVVIESRKDLMDYIRADLEMQCSSSSFLVRLLGFRSEDHVVKLKMHLRKAEYWHNTGSSVFHRLAYYYHSFQLKRLASSFCSEIPINVFGKGLIIWHAERIIVNPAAKVGEYCSLSSGVVIAQSHDKNPVIGDHVELMIDSKVLGGVNVADHVRIGACALIIRTIEEENTTWAGIPARKISDKGSIETPIPIQNLQQ
jgi:serine O-acetyltransferase